VAKLLVGPILCRNGGFAFDTFSREGGLRRGFPYRRIEEATYDRKVTLLGAGGQSNLARVGCETLGEFDQQRETLAEPMPAAA
jgi:hypothetical protein